MQTDPSSSTHSRANDALTRRAFAAAPALLLPTSFSAAAEPAQLRALSQKEAALLDLICDCIIPGDQDAGARQAGCVHYIDTQLAGTLTRFAAPYHEGLPLFEATCQQLAGHTFAELAPPERIHFLERVEAENPKGLAVFFSMVVDHTMQGFYGDPKHGGNAGSVSWKMLGIDEKLAAHPTHGGHE
jgi:gluconate 2-dehydrogenase gamma chain